jgi:FKBP-type peptidyl-prolyl cis-trans isomerase
MSHLYKFLAISLIATLFSSCLRESESELEQVIARDNAILERYIQNNQINATRTQSGFFYQKLTQNSEGAEIQNDDYVGVYFEIRSLDGQLVKSHMDETKEPIIFKQSMDGIWPVVFAYAAGLSRVGEELMVYSPSYLAFGSYGYQQLILSNSNLVIRLKIARKYTLDELKAREKEMILDYIEANDLQGFEEIADGIFRRILDAGDSGKNPSVNSSIVVFNFELFQLGDSRTTFESTPASRPSITIGATGGLRFLDRGLLGVRQDAEIEVLAYSFAAYDGSIQIIPSEIREDLFMKGEQIDLVRPFTPVLLKATIWSVL